MFKPLFGLVGIFSLAAMGCASSQPNAVAAGAGCQQLGDTTPAARAFLAPGNVYQANEIKEQVFLARAIQPMRSAGADLYVRAEPGVTEQHLERTLSCHAARGTAVNETDPFHPQTGRVKEVTVRPVHAGYAVRISGDSVATNREIWQRARTLSSSSVTIEQLAAADTQTDDL